MLEKRNLTETTISDCKTKIKRYTANLTAITKAIMDALNNEFEINNCKNFVKSEKRSGYQKQACNYDVLTCYDCREEKGICQRNIKVASHQDKQKLAAIDEDGRCTRCPNRCDWGRHTIDRFIYVPTIIIEKVETDQLRIKYGQRVYAFSNLELVIFNYLE